VFAAFVERFFDSIGRKRTGRFRAIRGEKRTFDRREPSGIVGPIVLKNSLDRGVRR
jgi:hypothetical protein